MANQNAPHDVATILAKLPEMAASRHPSGTPILIRRGVAGYFPLPSGDPDAFNAKHGVTPAQKMAMEAGSMFGWGLPGADPDCYAALNPTAPAPAATRPTEAELIAALRDLRNAASMLVNRAGHRVSRRIVDDAIASVVAASALIARAEG